MSILSSQTSAFGLLPGELRFVVVGSEWAVHFAEERLRIDEALAGCALDIQHIGSTAIPGIIAKPVLDIAVAIPNFESGHALVPRVVALGYMYHGENGIPRRHFFTRNGAYYLHIFEQGSLDWLRHLQFRDRLLVSPELVARYSELKLTAAKQANGDRNRYQDLKALFIEEF